jgi:RNA polymerase-binding transcription factor DksA
MQASRQRSRAFRIERPRPAVRHGGSGSVVVVSDEAMTPDIDAEEREPLDLDRIERDLAGVESALGRLDDGTYWTDELTGQPIPDDVLAADPVARRAG